MRLTTGLPEGWRAWRPQGSPPPPPALSAGSPADLLRDRASPCTRTLRGSQVLVWSASSLSRGAGGNAEGAAASGNGLAVPQSATQESPLPQQLPSPRRPRLKARGRTEPGHSQWPEAGNRPDRLRSVPQWDTGGIVDGPRTALSGRSRHERPQPVGFHFCDMPRTGKSARTERRRACGAGAAIAAASRAPPELMSCTPVNTLNMRPRALCVIMSQ